MYKVYIIHLIQLLVVVFYYPPFSTQLLQNIPLIAPTKEPPEHSEFLSKESETLESRLIGPESRINLIYQRQEDT